MPSFLEGKVKLKQLTSSGAMPLRFQVRCSYTSIAFISHILGIKLHLSSLHILA